jgi:hypothetical protein
VTYFVGSLFFTSAGYLQYWEVVNAPTTLDSSSPHRHRVFAWEPNRIDWWASGIQFIGTLYFNVSTGFALVTELNASQVNRVVWRPDAIGCVCFLVASALAWAEVSHGRLRPRFTLSAWIAMLNLVGSVAFGVSAIAAKVVSGSGEPRNVELVNLGTFVGALCFLVGALLLLPERTEETATVSA